MVKTPARDVRPRQAAARHITLWVPGALAFILGPALIIASALGALTEIRPATSAPAALTALDSEEQQFLSLINDYRAGQGLPVLSIDPQLEAASRWMSEDMATHDYFSHYDSLGRDPFQRMAAFGYDYNVWKGENLAAGTASAQVAFDLWKESPGHNSNMTNPNFLGIGVARAYGPSSGLSWYWTTDFGGLVNVDPPAVPTATPTHTVPSLTPTPTPSHSPTPTVAPSPTPTASPERPSGPTPSALPEPPSTATPTATPGPAGSPVQRLQGDMDCDAAVEARDALFVLRIVAGVPANVCPAASADVDCDGATNIADAMEILLYVAGVPPRITGGCPRIGAAAR